MTRSMPSSYVRFAHRGASRYGILDGEAIRELQGAPYAGSRETGAVVPASEAKLLAPCEPSKIIAVGLNYGSHLHGRPRPQRPGLFAKLPSAVIGPDEPIVIPEDASSVHYEGELVVVIGRRIRNADPATARAAAFGVTAGNDVSERTWQKDDLQWLRAKACDTFAPLGPAIVAGIDFADLAVQTRVNGELRQSARTRDLIFDVPSLIAYISRFITLFPGDVLYTGTPGTTAALAPGDLVEVEIEGVGVLRNPVVASTTKP